MTTYWQPHQVEQLRAIGLRLQQERERQSIILEDVSAKTRIRVALLQGIETAEINRLPEPVYVRGFIRRFEETLGLPIGELSGQLILEPTILGNVDPLTTYPPTPAKSDLAAAPKVAKPEAKIEAKSEPKQSPASTFRQSPVAAAEVAPAPLKPIAVHGSEAETRPSLEALPLRTVSDIKPVELKPSDPTVSPTVSPIDASQPKGQSQPESKAGNTPIVAPIPPSDPWADESASPAAIPVGDRPGQSPEIRIVPPPQSVFEPAGEQSAPSTTLLSMPQPRQFNVETEPTPWRPIALGIGLVGLLGLVGWGALNLSKPTVVNQASIETPSPSPTPLVAAAKPTPAKPVAPVSLTVDVKQSAWVQVETDGKLAYEGEIPKGGRKNWTAQKQIFFRTGLSNVVWVAVNGSPAKQFNIYPGPKDQTFGPSSR